MVTKQALRHWNEENFLDLTKQDLLEIARYYETWLKHGVEKATELIEEYDE